MESDPLIIVQAPPPLVADVDGCCGSPGVLKYPYCHQMIIQTHPRGDRRISEKINFSEISGATK